MIRDTIIVLVGIVAVLASPASESQSSYLNVDYGVTLYKADGPNDPTYADGQRFREDDQSLALTVGYAATDWLSAELSYADHGQTDTVFQPNPDMTFAIPPYSHQTIEATDVSIRMVVSTPEQRGFRLRGMAGYTRADIDSRIARPSDPNSTRNDTIADFEPGSADGALYGVTFDYAPSSRLRIKLSWNTRDYGNIHLQRASLGLGLHY